jgi:hypothetical protein
MDDPEVRRIIIQGFFEVWTQNEFLAHYKQTDYFNTLNDIQRRWATLSEAERQARIEGQAGVLLNLYRSEWGTDPVGGLDQLLIDAERVASGQLDLAAWNFQTRLSAETVGDTPAARRVVTEIQAQGEAAVTRSNLAGFVEDQWSSWVGTGRPPPEFMQQWSNWLFLNERSEQELEAELRDISTGRWGDLKPENVTYAAWSAPWKGEIARVLETGTINNDDPLLNHILSMGLTGADATAAMRHDQRFLQTNTFRGELSDAVADVGKQFGFIA